MSVLNNRGTSLIEIIVGMAILLLIIAPLPEVIRVIFDTQKYTLAQNHNVTGEREIFNAISDELRYAKTVNTTTVGEISYTVVTKVNDVYKDQSRRIYSQLEGKAKTLIIEYTDTENTSLKTTKKVSISTLNNVPNPITFQWDQSSKTLSVSIQLNDNSSCTKNPNLNYQSFSIVLLNT